MLVLVCGDRNWQDRQAILHRLSDLPDDTKVIHGGAKGADTLAGSVATELGFPVAVVEAQWEIYGRGAGPIRNKVMLGYRPDLVIAFHENITASKGTANMINQAKKAGIPVELITGGE